MIVIEMNPSRESLQCSRLQGDRVPDRQDRRQAGGRLSTYTNWPTISRAKTLACFEPTIDYVVTKIPRFAFEKFPEADATLTTQMKSVGRDDGDRPHLQGVVPEGAPRSGGRSFWTRLRQQRPLGYATSSPRS
jgi:hypothetical protein